MEERQHAKKCLYCKIEVCIVNNESKYRFGIELQCPLYGTFHSVEASSCNILYVHSKRSVPHCYGHDDLCTLRSHILCVDMDGERHRNERTLHLSRLNKMWHLDNSVVSSACEQKNSWCKMQLAVSRCKRGAVVSYFHYWSHVNKNSNFQFYPCSICPFDERGKLGDGASIF